MIHTHDLFSYLRNDGRKDDEFRDFSITVGDVGKSLSKFQSSIVDGNSFISSISSPSFGIPDGISSMQAGDAFVVASVFGPRQAESNAGSSSSKGIVHVKLSIAQFASEKFRRTTSDASLHLLASNLQSILESLIEVDKFPGSEIFCSVIFLRDDGSRFSLAFNSIMAALIHAGIPILDIAVAVNVIFHSNKIFIDPTASETISVLPETRIVSLASSGRIIGLVHTGKCAPPLLSKMILTASAAAETYSESMKKVLSNMLVKLSIQE